MPLYRIPNHPDINTNTSTLHIDNPLNWNKTNGNMGPSFIWLPFGYEKNKQ